MNSNKKKTYSIPSIQVCASDLDWEVLVGSDFESTKEDYTEDDIFGDD